MTGGGQDELDVSKRALGQIAQGITDALAELRELGSVGMAGMGDGFTELKLTSLQSGHDGLTATLDTFCERWAWGVRSLVQEANTFAYNVGLSAGLVYERDQYVEGGFKVLANAVLGGSPYASEQDVTGRDWDQILATNPYTNLRDADYSAASVVESAQKTDAAWKQTWEDIAPRPDTEKSAEVHREHRADGEHR
ncbi:hypothetical protein ABZ716_23060 [Streptomyces sp. NPDC006687]|uniref:hypothetical protein n=1 Tax=unclassified Streptomyces TaxID=2593676 RepID=UPI0033C660EC